MSKVLKEKIISNNKIAKTIYSMSIESDYICNNAKPGQFVNIKCCDGISALLRRPISICGIDRDKGTFNIVYEIKGAGTEYLSKKIAGEHVDLVGPLGKPFHIEEGYKRIAVIGGGIGIFPLLFVLNEARCDLKSAFVGFRSKECVVFEEEFKEKTESSFHGFIGKPYKKEDILKILYHFQNEHQEQFYLYALFQPFLKVLY